MVGHRAQHQRQRQPHALGGGVIGIFTRKIVVPIESLVDYWIVPQNRIYWRVGPVTMKPPGVVITPLAQQQKRHSKRESEFTLQLTADQQVSLSISGTDKYGNPVEIGGDTVWQSSDESIIQVQPGSSPTQALAVAVGPMGTAAVTVTNDADRDGTGDFMGSIAIDVVAGDIAEIAVNPGQVSEKGLEAGGGPATPPARPDAGDPGDNEIGGGPAPGRPNRPDAGLPNAPVRPGGGPVDPEGGTKPVPPPEGTTKPGSDRPSGGTLPSEGGAQPRRGR